MYVTDYRSVTSAPSRLLDVGKQTHEAGVLNRRGDLALILGAGASDGTRGDLAVGSNEARESLDIFVVDGFDLVLLEIANLTACTGFSKSHCSLPFRAVP